MIKERYMITAEMVKEKGTITGYLLGENPYIVSGHIIRGYVVKPETIEPVAVKPVKGVKIEEYKCPNCLAAAYEYLFTENEECVDIYYCPKCGQHLDWSGVE